MAFPGGDQKRKLVLALELQVILSAGFLVDKKAQKCKLIEQKSKEKKKM
jgi:hypothetical protein